LGDRHALRISSPRARGEGDGINRVTPTLSTGLAVRVSVVYCPDAAAWTRELEVPDGATLRSAIAKSGVLEAHPGLKLDGLDVGVFSRPRSLDDRAQEGDRIEIYRLLLVDPKEARRHRAELRRRRKNES
jgi:uncharacterized protein